MFLYVAKSWYNIGIKKVEIVRETNSSYWTVDAPTRCRKKQTQDEKCFATFEEAKKHLEDIYENELRIQEERLKSALNDWNTAKNLKEE